MPKDKHHDIPAPRENPNLFGHEAAEARFLHEFRQGLVHHAYLMTGPKGIGKATLAYRIARFLLGQGALKPQAEAESFSLFGDTSPPPLRGSPGGARDGAGLSLNNAPHLTSPLKGEELYLAPDETLFRRVALGSHTDLLTLTPAYDAKKHTEKSTITVDEARRVPEFLSLTPAEGEWRVVVIDAIDQLNANAANALLKILEEPPERAILLLVCHQPMAILPTIRSRCRTFKLAPPEQTAFSDVMNQVAPHIESHEYAALYALSHGAPGYAISLHEENAIGCYEGWLAAMQPGASVATRQQFADAQAARKSPDAWAALVHCWRMALQRVTMHPHTDGLPPIFRQEAQMLTSIAANVSPLTRRQWAEQGGRLIRDTEVFNLDKRYTIRLLADPGQLDRMAA